MLERPVLALLVGWRVAVGLLPVAAHHHQSSCRKLEDPWVPEPVEIRLPLWGCQELDQELLLIKDKIHLADLEVILL